MRRAPTRFSSSPTLRLTVDFGIARCLAAAVKLPVSATAAKTTIAFQIGPCVPLSSFWNSHSSNRTLVLSVGQWQISRMTLMRWTVAVGCGGSILAQVLPRERYEEVLRGGLP